jgi:hypothetical protein
MGLPLTRHLSLLLPEQGVGRDETDPPTLRTAICDVAAAAGDVESILVLEETYTGPTRGCSRYCWSLPKCLSDRL